MMDENCSRVLIFCLFVQKESLCRAVLHLLIELGARLEEKECRSCDAGRKENVRHGRGLFDLMLHLSDERSCAVS